MTPPPATPGPAAADVEMAMMLADQGMSIARSIAGRDLPLSGSALLAAEVRRLRQENAALAEAGERGDAGG